MRLTPALFFGLSVGLTVACNPSETPPSCGDPSTNSHINTDQNCQCDAGYQWCSEEADDFECCEPPEEDSPEPGEDETGTGGASTTEESGSDEDGGGKPGG